MTRTHMDARHLAIHEAGHAVVAWFLRGQIKRVTIDPRERYYHADLGGTVEGHIEVSVSGAPVLSPCISTGRKGVYRPRLPFENPVLRNLLVILAAGTYAAQSEGYEDKAEGDYHQSEELLRANGASDEQIQKEIWRASRRAYRLVSRLREEIRAVASALAERQSLTWDEVNAVLRSRGPAASPQPLLAAER